MRPGFARLAIRLSLMLIALTGCQAIFTEAPVSEEELLRLASEGECVNATPGNRLPGFRCRGDYGSFDK